MAKKNKLIMILNNDKLYLVVSDQKGHGHIIGMVPLSMTSIFDDFSYTIPVEAKKAQDNLLIVPDYFTGNTLYPFTSEKRSLAEAFIQRKLTESFPAAPETPNFFNYTFTRTGQDAGSLYAFFLQDPAFFKFYQWLIHAGIQTDRITTPAFIWRHKLEKIDQELFSGNFCLIHTLLAESHLYFFMQGIFLFSRSIKFPESLADDSEILDSLAYEITQSVYLFSQKVKAEIKGFYHVSSVAADLDMIDEKKLAERIEKNVQGIDIGPKNDPHPEEADQPLSGPLAAFSWQDLESEKILAVRHRKAALRKAWDPVQHVGMVTGLLVFLLLCGESFYLTLGSNKQFLSESHPLARDILINRRTITRYNELLDTIILERQHPDPAALLAGVINSLPENVTIQDLAFNLESPFMLTLRGHVKTDSPDLLRSTLSKMIAELTRRLKPARTPSMSDIRFDMEKGDSVNRSPGYSFNMQVDLQ